MDDFLKARILADAPALIAAQAIEEGDVEGNPIRTI